MDVAFKHLYYFLGLRCPLCFPLFFLRDDEHTYSFNDTPFNALRPSRLLADTLTGIAQQKLLGYSQVGRAILGIMSTFQHRPCRDPCWRIYFIKI